MSKKQLIQEILPWTNSELEALLQELISHGAETAKIDFKTEIETDTQEQKAELLKDISAIANTYDQNYSDHGFLIYGVNTKSIAGITETEQNTDKFQNTIEQLLKNYLTPMPQIYVVGFETSSGQKWGTIIIPPRNNKPYVFFKDIQCADSRKTRKKGEWFVRRGATTDPGLPEDLALITQKQTESLLEPLRDSIRGLQSRIAKTEEQYNSALFKLVERAVLAMPGGTEKASGEREEIEMNIGEAFGMDLPTRLKHKLRTPKDTITEDLIAEAKSLREHLDGADSGLPWAPQLNNPESNKKIIDNLEERTRSLQRAIATIILKDHKRIYEDALLRSVRILAKTTDVPSGIQYNRIGQALRYYPLGLILYTIFACGTASNRDDILKQVLDVPLKHPGRGEKSHITDTFFYWYAAKSLFNDVANQRKCEPIVERIRQVIRDYVGEMITEYSEPEFFFRGEFILALAHIDAGIAKGKDAEQRVPGPGLYLYLIEAQNPIAEFLLDRPEWFDKLYKHPLNEILGAFDKNAHKMEESGCWATGLHGLKTLEIYQEALKKKG